MRGGREEVEEDLDPGGWVAWVVDALVRGVITVLVVIVALAAVAVGVGGLIWWVGVP